MAHEVLSSHQICTLGSGVGAAGAEVLCDGEVVMDLPCCLARRGWFSANRTPVLITPQEVGNNELKISRAVAVLSMDE